MRVFILLRRRTQYVRLVNGLVDQKGFRLTTDGAAMLKTFQVNVQSFAEILNLFRLDATSYLIELKRSVLRQRNIDESQIQSALGQRKKARASKDFAEADSIRKTWLEKGVEFRDTPGGTEWDVVFIGG